MYTKQAPAQQRSACKGLPELCCPPCLSSHLLAVYSLQTWCWLYAIDGDVVQKVAQECSFRPYRSRCAKSQKPMKLAASSQCSHKQSFVRAAVIQQRLSAIDCGYLLGSYKVAGVVCTGSPTKDQNKCSDTTQAGHEQAIACQQDDVRQNLRGIDFMPCVR